MFFTQNLFAEDDFEEEFQELTEGFLQQTVEELAGVIMDSLDPEVPFEALSTRAADWIKGWSEKLAKIMKLNTHEAVENVLTDAIENGSSIQEIELTLKDMPQFDRPRARTTAITEVLAASSAAQHESYAQSPAVLKRNGGTAEGRRTILERTILISTAQLLVLTKNSRYLGAAKPACSRETRSFPRLSGFIVIAFYHLW